MGGIDNEWACVTKAVGQLPRGQLSGKRSVDEVRIKKGNGAGGLHVESVFTYSCDAATRK